MNGFVTDLFFTIQIIVLVYLSITSVYIFIFALASVFPYHPKTGSTSKPKRFAVLIPCYREDEIIFSVVTDALKQDYPPDKFKIIVIADSLEKSVLQELSLMPIVLFEIDPEISTKSYALNYALNRLPETEYDIAVVLDADNLMEPKFLQKVNNHYSSAFAAFQGHRVAKNHNTNFAILDAISEEINNSIFRKGHRVLGLSSALIGSAMAFDFASFKKLMSEINVVGGFDKELELKILGSRKAIEYLPDAIVFDEKVQNAKVFTQQRRRWLASQFYYFGIHFVPAIKALITKGNLDYFNKSFQHIHLPRILLLGITAIFMATTWFFNPHFVSLWWTLSFILTAAALLLSIPLRYHNIATLKAALVLPMGFFFMFVSLMRIKGANKRFLHTRHTYNTDWTNNKKTE
jgi:cellulose synthase/poly-beta-1,6-N-acetylglucosamine synthase-like glycosyltransferase